MKLKRSTLLGLILGVLAGLAAHAQSPTANGQRPMAFQEEFHKIYPLTPGGHIELKNINGFVKISSWDRDQVKVDALKYAGTKERLDQAHIVVEADPGAIYIKTRYDDGHTLTFTDDDIVHNPATVDYMLTVPAAARLDAIKLINGNLDIQNLTGDVSASCINGHLRASALRGRTDLSTVNGTLEYSYASVILSERPGVGRESKDLGERPARDERSESPNAPTRASELQDVKLKSVNGRIVATLPSNTDAELRAKTVSGWIHNDFGLPVDDGHYVGHSLAGRLGSGAARIEMKNVNGSVHIQRASDGKPLSAVQNLLPPKREKETSF